MRGIRKTDGGPREYTQKQEGFQLAGQAGQGEAENTTIRDLLSDDLYTEAVLDFLRATRVGEFKEGAICK